MKIKSLRLVGIRCFEDTGSIELSPTCNIFVGTNNTGKSTLLRGLLAFQGFPIRNDDIRPGSDDAFHEMVLARVQPSDQIRHRPRARRGFNSPLRVVRDLRRQPPADDNTVVVPDDHGAFHNTRPNHTIVPFIARRKALEFNHDITLGNQNKLSGTFSNLYSRIDLLATAGHPRHEAFQDALKQIVGLPITTKATSAGKEAGFYFDDKHFVSLDKMGDGVSELVAFIVELCLELDKVFVIEEPETNLHPSGLKALLNMIRLSLEHNQFFISTHSNIVLRELGAVEGTQVFRTTRERDAPRAPSTVERLPQTPAAHIELLRELGYEFADFGLHEGWLFLEEASAETILNRILIPNFVPTLRGRLRTFSVGGVSNLEPAIAEFQRLITFVHLQPVYQGRVWIRADGDDIGLKTIDALRVKFQKLNEETCTVFSQTAFEYFYPAQFKGRAKEALAIREKSSRRAAKEKLLAEVLNWTDEVGQSAIQAWESSASEPIEMLRSIESVLNGSRSAELGILPSARH